MRIRRNKWMKTWPVSRIDARQGRGRTAHDVYSRARQSSWRKQMNFRPFHFYAKSFFLLGTNLPFATCNFGAVERIENYLFAGRAAHVISTFGNHRASTLLSLRSAFQLVANNDDSLQSTRSVQRRTRASAMYGVRRSSAPNGRTASFRLSQSKSSILFASILFLPLSRKEKLSH